MQLTTTKFRIYQVRCTCYLSSIFFFFLDRQFRGDVAILVFFKTMTSYNPTSLTPSLFTEVPELSQESEQSCICVLGISNLPISTIFLLNFWNFSDSVIFFFHCIIGCEKRTIMMYRQQSLQKKYCKAEQYCFGAWGQAETSLKIVDLSWKYPKHNEQIKIKRQLLSPWDTSEIHGPLLGSPSPVPMHRMNPLSKALLS